MLSAWTGPEYLGIVVAAFFGYKLFNALLDKFIAKAGDNNYVRLEDCERCKKDQELARDRIFQELRRVRKAVFAMAAKQGINPEDIDSLQDLL